MTDLDPIQFEKFVAELWARRGWETEVTSGSNDRGIDVIAEKHFPYEEKVLIQAKKYAQGNRVSGPEIQKYASLKQRDGVDEVIIVTTSEFTAQAIELSQEYNIKLINGKTVLNMIIEGSAEDLLQQYTSLLSKCPSCNGDIKDEHSYCESCGEYLTPYRTPDIVAQNKRETRIEIEKDDEPSDPDEVILKTRGRKFAAENGDTVGRKLREILISSGESRNRALRVHREHIGFVNENREFYIVAIGTNPTRLNEQELDQGEKAEINPGDTIELSGVISINVEGFR
ncbi:restriction endonuclease [Halomicrobium salinisoli]|uniref:restriction endonuclease n=1 Tax=Halomicrobium salinisoli TaxID=2878391 RepID=UPI001CEFDA9F|nr:restriction endonuclease [Halomicrobium salinisoli]